MTNENHAFLQKLHETTTTQLSSDKKKMMIYLLSTVFFTVLGTFVILYSIGIVSITLLILGLLASSFIIIYSIHKLLMSKRNRQICIWLMNDITLAKKFPNKYIHECDKLEEHVRTCKSCAIYDHVKFIIGEKLLWIIKFKSKKDSYPKIGGYDNSTCPYCENELVVK